VSKKKKEIGTHNLPSGPRSDLTVPALFMRRVLRALIEDARILAAAMAAFSLCASKSNVEDDDDGAGWTLNVGLAPGTVRVISGASDIEKVGNAY